MPVLCLAVEAVNKEVAHQLLSGKMNSRLALSVNLTHIMMEQLARSWFFFFRHGHFLFSLLFNILRRNRQRTFMSCLTGGQHISYTFLLAQLQ